MNRLFWFINIILLALAVVLTMAIVRYAPPSNGTPVVAGGKKNASVRSEPATGGLLAAFRQKAFGAEAVTPTDTKPIWQQSLFRPDRTEEEPSESGDDAGPIAAPGDLDLIGIGILGDMKAAIILSASKQTPGARNFGPAAGFQQNPAVPAAKKEKTRHVYRVGQAIGDSGYQLKEIHTDEVVITHGTTEQTLKIVFGDDSSLKRQSEAAADSQRRTDMNRAAMAAATPPPNVMPNNNTHGLPPPPPPLVPGVASAGGNGAPVMSDETKKRIEEIRMRREEIIRRMREQAGQNNPR